MSCGVGVLIAMHGRSRMIIAPGGTFEPILVWLTGGSSADELPNKFGITLVFVRYTRRFT